jgi:hypothetical protein
MVNKKATDMNFPNRRNFTTDEINILANIDGVTITNDEMTKNDLICNATDSGFMVEGPGGTDLGGTLDDVRNLFTGATA